MNRIARSVSLWVVLVGPSLWSADPDPDKTLKAVDRLLKTGDLETATKLLTSAIKDSPDPSLRLKLAEVYVLARKEDEALNQLDEIQVQLTKKEKDSGPLSPKERDLLKDSGARMEKILRSGKELHELDRRVIKLYFELGAKLVSRKDFRGARLAMARIEKLDPQCEEVGKLSILIEGGGWKDLTGFSVEDKEYHDDSFGINEVPWYARAAFAKFKSATGIQKCIFLHPLDHGKGFITFRSTSPISSLKASVALISSSGGDARFKVRIKDKEVYDSGPVLSGEKPKAIVVNFPASHEITLVTDSNGPYDADHCIWLDPLVK